MPAVRPPTYPLQYAVKVLDINNGLPASYFGGPDDEYKEDGEDYDDSEDFGNIRDYADGYESWTWTSATKLTKLWFIEGSKAEEEMFTFEDENRPLHMLTSVGM